MSNAGSFSEALGRASAGDARIVVDLTGVEYLDSAGLTVLFTHASHIELVAKPLLAPVLTISGLADITHCPRSTQVRTATVLSEIRG